MIRRLKQKLLNKRGFSLAETLMAVLILLMVSEVVAGGIPAAANAYYKVIEASNAQVLLSTTMTKFRDELSTARISSLDTINVSGDNSSITYTRSNGNRVKLVSYGNENTKKGIYLCIEDASGRTISERLLISEAASNKNLHLECAFYYDPSTGIVTIQDINVKKGNKTITSMADYEIRVISALGV